MPTGDVIAIIAVNAIVSHDIVGGGRTAAVVVHVARGGRAEPLPYESFIFKLAAERSTI